MYEYLVTESVGQYRPFSGGVASRFATAILLPWSHQFYMTILEVQMIQISSIKVISLMVKFIKFIKFWHFISIKFYGVGPPNMWV